MQAEKRKRWVDFFAGAGGASTGIMRAGGKVVVAVNHNAEALAAHAKNHPDTVHLNEDVREVDPYMLAARFPADAAWISAECTHFSGAKGGTSRNADSRQLSEVFVAYAAVCRWGLIIVENVREFLKWGPVVPKLADGAGYLPGQAVLERRYCEVQVRLMEARCAHDKVSEELHNRLMDTLSARMDAYDNYKRDKAGMMVFVPYKPLEGSMYKRWLEHFRRLGYSYEHRLLDSADYGAPQSRLRYFGVFRLGDAGPFEWPQQTHAKGGKGGLKPWVPCSTILELDKPGRSIFERGKPLVDATLSRIRAGLDRYAKEGSVVMVDRYHSGSVPVGAGSPLPTVMASMEKALVCVSTVDSYTHGSAQQPVDVPLATQMAKRDKYLAVSYVVPTSFGNRPHGLDVPLQTVLACKRYTYMCRADYLVKEYSSKGLPHLNISGTSAPLGSIMTTDKHKSVAGFLIKYHGTGENVVGIDGPMSTLTTKDRLGMVRVDYVADTRGGGRGNSDKRTVGMGSPLNTVAASYGPSFVQAWLESGGDGIDLAPEGVPYMLRRHDPQRPQCPWTRVVGHYEVDNRVVDILYRMLNVEELRRGQGFPEGYFLGVADTKAKYFIGNAVQVDMAEALVRAFSGKPKKFLETA